MTDQSSLLGMLREALGGEVRTRQAGEIVFRQGDAVSSLYGVETGRVKLERSTAEGRRVLVYVARSGETFAEAALFHDAFNCDAVAATRSRIVTFSRRSVLDLLRGDTRRAEQIVRLLASQVRALRTRLELRNILSARERILQYLRQEADEDGVLLVEAPLKELAAELGLAHETLYRELGRLESEGFLARTEGRIRLVERVD